MLCPLLVIAGCVLAGKNDIDTDCRESECAWYDGISGKCAVKSLGAIAINLCTIANTLEEK